MLLFKLLLRAIPYTHCKYKLHMAGGSRRPHLEHTRWGRSWQALSGAKGSLWAMPRTILALLVEMK